jgi:hypothetical protein
VPQHSGRPSSKSALNVDGTLRPSAWPPWAQRRSIRFTEHLTGDGPTAFAHVAGSGWRDRVEADGCALSQRAIDGVAQVEEPGERGGAPGARGGVALASAHPGLHGSAQMENPTKASTAKLRTIIASAATSMMENRLRSNAMVRYWAAVERPL